MNIEQPTDIWSLPQYVFFWRQTRLHVRSHWLTIVGWQVAETLDAQWLQVL